jgi:hypothetical protein
VHPLDTGPSFTAPASVTVSALTLSGATNVASYTAPLVVSLPGLLSSGFSISMTASTFTTTTGPVQTLPSTASSVTGVACSGLLGLCTTIINTVGYPKTLTAGTPTMIYSVAAALSAGQVTLTPTIQISVPGSAYAGTYASTLTITSASGP